MKILMDEKGKEIQEIFYHETGHYIPMIYTGENIEGFKIKEIGICYTSQEVYSWTTPLIPPSHDNYRQLSNLRLRIFCQIGSWGVSFNCYLLRARQN